MNRTKYVFLALIFFIPFLLGVGIVGYWFWTSRVEQQALLPSFGPVPAFSLTTETKEPFTRRNLEGSISVVDFIFTQCGGACPVMSSKLAGLQPTLLTDPHIQFVSFSVDPQNDTPEVLQEYARQYGAREGRWTFLTGPKPDIAHISRDGFHLGLDVEGDSTIIHSQKFVLVDHHGVIRGYYDSEDDEAMTLLVRDAKALAAKVPS